MEWLETVYVGGVRLEAFTTSGGLGTMCETFADRVENLDYKSLRYPGHASLMNFFFHELLMREDRAAAGKILTHAKPPVDDDVVYVHVAAEGWTEGRLGRREFVRAYYPIEIEGKSRTAIAWTTAASVVAVIEMARSGALPPAGFLKQETIPLERFLETRTGTALRGAGPERTVIWLAPVASGQMSIPIAPTIQRTPRCAPERPRCAWRDWGSCRCCTGVELVHRLDPVRVDMRRVAPKIGRGA